MMMTQRKFPMFLKMTAVMLIAIAGCFALLGIFAPQEFHIEKTVVIHQPKDKVFAFVRKFRNQNQWITLFLKDQQTKFQFEGMDGTVGFVSAWQSETPEVGKAEQVVTRIQAGERIESQLRYQEPVQRDFHTYLVLDVVGENRTKVIFGMTNQMIFPQNVLNLIQNIFFNFEKNMSSNVDQTLEKLKVTLESKDKPT